MSPPTAPAAPPARPHSAHPYMTLSSAIFQRPGATTPGSTPGASPVDVPAHVSTRPSGSRGVSSSSFGVLYRDRETDWEDAWNSGSDREDGDGDGNVVDGDGIDVGTSVRAIAAPIPIRKTTASMSSASISNAGKEEPSVSSSISKSWVSASYHPTPAMQSRSSLSSKATRSTTAASSSPTQTSSPSVATARLPPGGAWEIVEPADVDEELEPPIKVGKEVIRDDVEDVLRDPMQLLQTLSLAPPTPVQEIPSSPFPLTPATASPARNSTPTASGSSLKTAKGKDGVHRARSVRTVRRRERFHRALKGRAEDGGGVDLAELRRLAWSGVPSEVRPIVWQLLLNYLPQPVQPRLATLNRKRKEYAQLVDQYFGRGLSALDQQIWHQIEIDVPRTRPGAPLWSCPATQRSLERILYVWAIRHPASGYVQGINDLATPFFEVFLSAYVDTDPELFDVGLLSPHVLAAIEADSFWCLTKLLDGIQDHYISQQPGIQRLVKRMGELVKRIDAPLSQHFEEQGVEYMQFAFRWMNCLLMREISVKCTIRMWDTYLSEGADAFSQFHLYVCSALLVKFSDRLREMDFQEMIMFLQRLPTHSWTDHDIELLLSEAYVLKTVWQGAENHFANLAASTSSGGMLGR